MEGEVVSTRGREGYWLFKFVYLKKRNPTFLAVVCFIVQIKVYKQISGQ